MNILVANLYKDYIVKYDLNIMKEFTGEFDGEEVLSMLKGITYEKLIIDLTAIRKYNDLNSIRKLTKEIESNRIVLVLANDPICKSDYYTSNLVNMGLYNFTMIPGEITTLLVAPRTYEEAKNVNYNNY